MSRDFIFVLTTIKEWCIFIAPYAAIAILPAIAVGNRVMKSITKDITKENKKKV